MKRKLQVGVMGSAADLNYSKDLAELAFAVGAAVARRGHILVYGAEKDLDSLSTTAGRGAKSEGGLVVGITYGVGKEIWDTEGITDVVIPTGIARGGGREFVLVNACDVLITLSGGSGTLNEIAVAYQLNVPIVGMVGTGGWTDKLAGEFLDARNRFRVEKATTAEEAVQIAEKITGFDS